LDSEAVKKWLHNFICSINDLSDVDFTKKTIKNIHSLVSQPCSPTNLSNADEMAKTGYAVFWNELHRRKEYLIKTQ
jgi:hypothetical protein